MREARPKKIIAQSQPDFTSVDFNLVGKVTLGGYLYPLINKTIKK